MQNQFRGQIINKMTYRPKCYLPLIRMPNVLMLLSFCLV